MNVSVRMRHIRFIALTVTQFIFLVGINIAFSIPSAAQNIHIENTNPNSPNAARSTFSLTVSSDLDTEYLSGTEWAPVVNAWKHPTWPNLQDASWVWKSYLVTPDEALNGSAIISFRRSFFVPSDAQDITGTIQITADNAYELSMNGLVIGQDGVLDTNGADPGYRTVEMYQINSQPGWNELHVRVINYKSAINSSNPKSNPAGLLFRADIEGTVGSVSGRITSPTNNITIGPSTLLLSADAWAEGQNSVEEVKFFVFYDGIWHAAGTDVMPPYEVIWQTPNTLRSQQLQFAIHIVDGMNNTIEFVDAVRGVYYLESLGNPDVDENWIPTRAYLNQRSLEPNGDSKCSAASMSMVLAMNSIIGWDYETMRDKANEMYPRVLNSNGVANVGDMVAELKRQGMDAKASGYAVNTAWSTIKREIDAGYPVIVRTENVTAAGHFFVAVGYRNTAGSRQVITYDPFGRWLGTCCTDNYDMNSRDARSRKGQWASYDFDLAFGRYNWLITGLPDESEPSRANVHDVPSTRPDLISDEPENIGTYTGVNIEVEEKAFLPLMRYD